MNHFLSTDIPTLLFGFVFYYPFFMAWLWMLGGLIYFVAYERHDDFTQPDFTQAETPRISIIVPCYNEEPNVREVIAHLQNLNYPNYEVLAVNDGSHDRTGEILNELVEQYPSLMAIHQDKNQGKAVGLILKRCIFWLATLLIIRRSPRSLEIHASAIVLHYLDACRWENSPPRWGSLNAASRSLADYLPYPALSPYFVKARSKKWVIGASIC